MDTSGVFGSVVLLDWATVLTYASFLGFALFGSFCRAMFGLYRAYTTFPDFVPEKARIGVEIVASTFFGLLATVILREMNLLNYALPVVALIAGLLGADLISLITKKLGVSKGMQVILSERQMQDADLSDRQVRAMRYARENGSISNSIYQKINDAGPRTANADLQSLVRKGRLSKKGRTKDVRYAPVRKIDSTGNSTVILRPARGVEKGAEKGAESSQGAQTADFEACRRLFQGLGSRIPGRRDKQGAEKTATA
jgi:hypothetical protein